MSGSRYRCTSCGNLTRFDVTVLQRTKAYYHFSLGGDLSVEDPEVLDEQVEQVVCRWCGPPGQVVSVEAGTPAAGESEQTH